MGEWGTIGKLSVLPPIKCYQQHIHTCNLFHQSMTANLMVFFITSVAALALSASVISGALCFLLIVPIFLEPIVFYRKEKKKKTIEKV